MRLSEGGRARQIVAFPTARRLAAALAAAHGGAGRAEDAEGLDTEGLGAARGAPRPRLAREPDAAARAAAAPACRACLPAACPDAAVAPGGMPVLSVPPAPEASEASGARASPAGASARLRAPPPPDPALGGIELHSGGERVVPGRVNSSTPRGSPAAPAARPPGAREASSAQLCADASGAGRRRRAPAAGSGSGAATPVQPGERGSSRAAGGLRPLRCAWRVRLRECVDAAPVVLVQPRAGAPEHPGSPGRSPCAPRGPAGGRWFALACSHGGDVVCVDGASGARVWDAALPGRADAGLALAADLQARIDLNPSLSKRLLRCDSHSPRCYRHIVGVPAPLLPRDTWRRMRRRALSLCSGSCLTSDSLSSGRARPCRSGKTLRICT
jgi:hypothetical protein